MANAAHSAYPSSAHAGASLCIDLGAIRRNYRLLRRQAGKATCAAVLKADAYSLGAGRIAPVLEQDGCRNFFVAHLDEGIALRRCLATRSEIFVLHGPPPGAEQECIEHGLIPVLNSLQQVAGWRKLCHRLGRRLAAVIQVDTGMSRMGLAPDEAELLLLYQSSLNAIDLRYLMSHLACADLPTHSMNEMQLRSFLTLRSRFPAMPASLANSSGIFLGGPYQFDLVRPGAALYGLAPIAGEANPMHPVVTLQGKIIQIRTIGAGNCVGYGMTYRAAGKRVIATVAIGYADGWMRSMSNRGMAFIDGICAPIVGTVSMDSITLDVSGIEEGRLFPGTMVELLGPHQSVDAVAARAGTISYEILTSLGNRFHRTYRDVSAACEEAPYGEAVSSL